MARLRFGWTLEFLDDPAEGLTFKFWSGEGDLTLGGETYAGTNGVISIAPPREAAGESVRLTASMDASDPAVRLQLRRDVGPLKVEIRYIYHDADALSPAWVSTGKRFVGRLSSPVLQGAVYVVEVESMVSDIDRGRARSWSDDSHRSAHPGDLGMEYLNLYAEGIKTKWPN